MVRVRMNLFFDCEFTGLRKNTTLISLGIVAEDGRKFYAEFIDFDSSQCDEWINENVINNLLLKENEDEFLADYAPIGENRSHFVKGTTWLIRDELAAWLSQFDSVQFVSDVCHYDFVLLIDLFGTAFDLPKNVSPVCHDINSDIAKHYGISEAEAFDKSREEIVLELCGQAVPGRKHNSLYDAEVIKAIYGGISDER